MNARRAGWLASVLLLAAWPGRAQTLQAPETVAAPQSAAAAFDAAMQHYTTQDFAAAFDALAALADRGHPDAARIALMMRAHGPRLFGRSFPVEPARRARWLDAAAPQT